MFKIYASELGTVGMLGQFHLCAYEFPTTLTKGVVHSLQQVVIRLTLSVIRRYKANGGTLTLSTLTQGRIQTSDGRPRTGTFNQMLITVNYMATCSVNNSDKMGLYLGANICNRRTYSR